MFDHMGFNVADFARSKAFYLAALTPLGIGMRASGDNWMMLGKDDAGLWIGAAGPAASPIHLAFAAADRHQVHRFYEAALAAGGRDNGPPGLRDYGPNYHAAFVLDPDGHNVEAVCRTGQTAQ